jgi:succinate dehydrogenase / fumarate reductase membrane anchor subunit
MSFITDRKRAAVLGSARSGTKHFWEQRISAIALLVLTPLFVFPFAYNVGDGYAAVHAAYAHPVNAIIGIAFIITAWLHWFQGITVVIEDYVHGRMELISIISLRLIASFFALAGIVALLKITLGA